MAAHRLVILRMTLSCGERSDVRCSSTSPWLFFCFSRDGGGGFRTRQWSEIPVAHVLVLLLPLGQVPSLRLPTRGAVWRRCSVGDKGDRVGRGPACCQVADGTAWSVRRKRRKLRRRVSADTPASAGEMAWLGCKCRICADASVAGQVKVKSCTWRLGEVA